MAASGVAVVGSALPRRNIRRTIPIIGSTTSAKENSASTAKWFLIASRNSVFKRAKAAQETACLSDTRTSTPPQVRARDGRAVRRYETFLSSHSMEISVTVRWYFAWFAQKQRGRPNWRPRFTSHLASDAPGYCLPDWVFCRSGVPQKRASARLVHTRTTKEAPEGPLKFWEADPAGNAKSQGHPAR